MTIYEQTLKSLEAQFKIATDAVTAQHKQAMEAVLLAGAQELQGKAILITKAEQPEIKVMPPEIKVMPPEIKVTAPEIKVTAPEIKVMPPELKVSGPVPKVKSAKSVNTEPPPFIAPPAQNIHAENVTIGADGVVHVTWAPGPGPVVPLTAVPVPMARNVKMEPPPFIAAPAPPGSTAAPWMPPPPIASEWATLAPKGTPAPVFVPGQPPVTVADEDEEDEAEDVRQPGDINDAWCPEAGQTWDDEPEPVDPWGDARPPAPAAPPSPVPAVVQAPPPAPAELGDPSRDPDRTAARFVPDTASRRSNRVAALTGGGEPKLASVRSEELREAARPNLKALLHLVYVGPNGRPLMTYADVIGMDTDMMVDAILAHEVAKGWVTEEHRAVN
jgi:hypothetical protein